LALVTQLVLKPGDVVVVESPTYSGALDLFRTFGLRIVGAPIDEHGLQVEALEQALQQHHPKLIYAMPNFQNPTGACLSNQRRRQLIALAARYNIPILEDDFVGDLRYEGRAQPALKVARPGRQCDLCEHFFQDADARIARGLFGGPGPDLRQPGQLQARPTIWRLAT